MRRLLAETLEGRQLLTLVTAVDPPADSHSAPPSTNVAATFDQIINGDSATSGTFAVSGMQSGALVGAASAVSAAGNTITLDPTSDLFPGELVAVTATAAIQSTSADPAVPRVWQFRTGVAAGTGTFGDSTQVLGGPSPSFDAALGDLDADGDLDAFVANAQAGNRIWLNTDGQFSDSGQVLGDHGSASVALGDVDQDGDLDAFVTNIYDGNRIWLNYGSEFRDSGQSLGNFDSFSVALGDVDGDGDLDAYVANFAQANRVWLNDGGQFTDSGQSLGDHGSYDVALGDLDQDGDLDAFVSNSYQPNRIWLNSGGVFADSGQSLAQNDSLGVSLGDLDGDGDLDAYVANYAHGNRVWRNDNGAFVDSGQALGFLNSWDAELGDVDGDGDLDAVAANGYRDGNRVWLNDGGVFTENGQSLGNHNSTSLSLGDLDGDGDLDAFSTNFVQPNRVWLNENGAVPDVTLGVDAETIPEAGGVANVTATLSAVSSLPVVIDLAIAGTAVANVDYTISGSQIVIPAGAMTGSATLSAIQDPVEEPDETVVIDVLTITNGQELGIQQVSVAILDDDSPVLGVSTLTATSSGFVVEFTAPLDISLLNLYDTESAGLGPADVLLQGAASGLIAGSLVVDPDLGVATFNSTGEPLAADTYTVTILGGDNGFRSATGALLDADGDGTAGGDFNQNFVIPESAANAVVVSLPDFVRGPGQEVNTPADGTTGIPLTISNGAGVRNAEVRIGYDPTLLVIASATVGVAMPVGSTVVLDTATAGTAILTFSSPSDLPSESSALVQLQAVVPAANASANYLRQQILDVHGVTITDVNANPIPAVEDDAVHLVGYFADTSGNGRINASDAARLARVAALLDTGFAEMPRTDPRIISDITGNGRINAADASAIARAAALIPVPQIPPIPPGVIITGVAPSDLGSGLPGFTDTAAKPSTAPPAVTAWPSADGLAQPHAMQLEFDAERAIGAVFAEEEDGLRLSSEALKAAVDELLATL